MGRLSGIVGALSLALSVAVMSAPAPVEHEVIVREVRDAELEAQVTALTARLELVTEQRDKLRAWKDTLARRNYAKNRIIDRLEERLQDEQLTLTQLDELWFAGYRAMGGTNEAAFATVILPCESGGVAEPHEAHGDRTLGHSWGRAQVHRPSWRSTFNATFGLEFDDWITNPVLNGAQSAIVEAEQGLGAWTCWRNR